MTAASTDSLPTKTAIRKAVGRGAFVVADAAAAFEVTAPTARKRLAALVEAGVIEVLPETRKNTAEDGTVLRGRPATQYKVASGK